MESHASDLTANARISLISTEMQDSSARAKEDGGKFPKKRFVFPDIVKFSKERAFTALIGPRGAGKSVLLKQLHHASEESLYISLDAHKPASLYNIARELSDRKTHLLLLDEIHAFPNYGIELKKIYDFLPDMHIAFTSSSAIALHDAVYDLSRRVRILKVHPFSFREFLYFERGRDVPALGWKELLDLERSNEYYGKVIDAESLLFEAYMTGRNYPFTMGQNSQKGLFENMLETIIEKDLVVPSMITLAESYEVRKMLGFIGRSPAEGISYTSIARNIGITPHKAQKYVELLQKAFLLNAVMPKGTNLSREPKILMAPPYRLIYKPYEDCIGALREDFFVDAAKRLKMEFDYLKGLRGNKTPDYVLDDVICEVGGASKGKKQFKGFSAKKKLIFTQPGTIDDMRRPLFFAGMLEEKQ